MTQDPLFMGESRIAWSHRLGRVIRVGSPAAISISDVEQFRKGILTGDSAGAERMLDYLHGLYRGMVQSYIEWIHNWQYFVTEHQSARAAETIDAFARTACQQTVNYPVIDGSVAAMLHEAIAPSRPGDKAELPTERVTGPLTALDIAHSAVLAAVRREHTEEATAAFYEYVSRARYFHDALVAYVGTFASAAADRFGQAFAEEGLQNTLAACTYYEPWWQEIAALQPAELVLVLAEEFRAHFSGDGRNGAVEILEEPDRYRLVFDPCGSGGAFRRACAGDGGTITFAKPSHATWGLAGQVPAYCAHCALNERTSIAKLGYPAWVTEFDPDPMKPCGWTVYKSPHLIPERYFARLGILKPSPITKEQENDG